MSSAQKNSEYEKNSKLSTKNSACRRVEPTRSSKNLVKKKPALVTCTFLQEHTCSTSDQNMTLKPFKTILQVVSIILTCAFGGAARTDARRGKATAAAGAQVELSSCRRRSSSSHRRVLRPPSSSSPLTVAP